MTNWTDNDLCVLFTSSMKSGYGGAKFAMSREDAMKFCSDERTHGKDWAFFWTSAKNYFIHNTNPNRMEKWKDNGMTDEVIADLGLTKIGYEEAREIFRELGLIPNK